MLPSCAAVPSLRTRWQTRSDAFGLDTGPADGKPDADQPPVAMPGAPRDAARGHAGGGHQRPADAVQASSVRDQKRGARH
jgi:hypothetical protein